MKQIEGKLSDKRIQLTEEGLQNYNKFIENYVYWEAYIGPTDYIPIEELKKKYERFLK